MFILVSMLILVEVIFIFFTYPLKKAWGYVLMYLSLLTMLSGYMIYIVKTGGYRENFASLMLFPNSLISLINNSIISYSKLYLLTQYSRLLFPALVLLIAKNASFDRISKCKFLSKFILFVPFIILCILLNNKIYYLIFTKSFVLQKVVQILVLSYIGLYIFFMLFILIKEIRNTALSWYRRQTIYLTIAMVFIVIIYLTFATMDPIMLIQDYIHIRTGAYSLFLNSKINIGYVIFVAMLMAVSSIVNTYAMLKSTKIEYDENRLEMKISKTIKGSSFVSSGLMHGLKNKLLTEKVMTLDLIDLIDKQASYKEIRNVADNLLNEQKQTSAHLEIVKKSLRNFDTHLLLENINSVFIPIKDEIYKKYPNVNISFEIDDGLVLVDKVLILESIINLIDNSVDAIRNVVNGFVLIKVSFTRGYCLIEVRDNGCGIKKDIIKNLFMPFVTSKNMLHNWGFGLCFTRQVIKKHLGNIRFESKEGVGTSFFITLPRIY